VVTEEGGFGAVLGDQFRGERIELSPFWRDVLSYRVAKGGLTVCW
jgi:hypothetical protein